MRRSPETIRYTLKNFDADHQSLAIFPNHRGALTTEDKRSIFKLYTHGSTVAQLCKRFKRTRTSIQRILLDMRLEQMVNCHWTTPTRILSLSNVKMSISGLCRSRQRRREGKVPAGLPVIWLPCMTLRYWRAGVPSVPEDELFETFREQAEESLSTAEGSKTAIMDRIDDLYEAAVLVKIA